MAGLAINPLQSVVADKNVYVNKKLGVLFYKPDNWVFIKVADYGKLLSEELSENEWNDLKVNYLDDGENIVCILTRYDNNSDNINKIFNPVISLSVTPKSWIEKLGLEKYGLTVKPMGEIHSDKPGFRTIKKYEIQEISGTDFLQSDAEYLLESKTLNKNFKIETRTFQFEYNDYYLDFQCHQSTELNETAFEEFEKLKNNLRLL